MTRPPTQPPARFLRRLLVILLPAPHRDVVLTHLDEEYALMQRSRSQRSAARWYWRQVIGSLPGALRMRMQFRARFLLADFLHDAGYGFRQIRRAPGFSIAAVAMLAIGLGLVAGAYTVANGLFVRGWDVPDNGRVFRTAGTATGAPEGGRINAGVSYDA